MFDKVKSGSSVEMKEEDDGFTETERKELNRLKELLAKNK